MSYEAPFVGSPNPGFDRVHFNFAIPNQTIDLLIEWLQIHGWSHIGGTKSVCDIIAIAPPTHYDPDDPFPQVAFHNIGMFFGKNFRWYDQWSTEGGPFGSGEPDPTDPFSDPPVIGVPIGLGNTVAAVQDTLDKFREKFNATFNGPAPPFYEITWELDPDTSGVIWYGHIESGDISTAENRYVGLDWTLAAENMAGPPPRRGGYYLYSYPNPTTGDSMRLWLFNNEQGRLTLQVQFNGIEGYDTEEFAMSPGPMFCHCSQYQFSCQPEGGPGAAVPGTTGGLLASALYVPPLYARRTLSIADITNEPGQDRIIRTVSYHFLRPGAKFEIAGVLSDPPDPDSGVMKMNKEVWVRDVLDLTRFTASASPGGSAIQGDTGPDYDSGGSFSVGVAHALIATTALTTVPFGNESTYAVVNEGFFFGQTGTRPGFFINIVPGVWGGGNGLGSEYDPLMGPSQKLMVAPAYVMLAEHNDREARIVGRLWDMFVLMSEGAPQQETYFGEDNDRFMCWMYWDAVLRQMQMSLWLRIEENATSTGYGGG